MENKIVVTITDYNRLMGMLDVASNNVKMPSVVNNLYKSLCAAKILPQEKIDRKIITMNSRVHLKDLSSKRETEITITYPQEADPAERRVSVFSEIGSALFGRKECDVVSWRVPKGIGLFEIIEVTYQPEAAGHFFL
jgi:regulator of nucleoside diphosphate kinase